MPAPARVRGNDWKSLDVAPLEGFEPHLRATVVVPYYEAPDALALTLAGLERQSYPRELFEVVVVDDGSDPPLELSEPSPLEVRVIHQPDLGFGLARARNNGARAASGDIVVFLDCDMIPTDEWLAAHARWHHAADDAITIGFRRHVEVSGISADDVRHRSGSLEDLFADRPSQRPEWIEFHMARTRELTSDDDDLFRVTSGGNLGISRCFWMDAGGNDESFTQWGAEDVEFGYRAFTRGALLVPERRAQCWHQGEGAAPSESESRSLAQQRARLSQLIAHDGFRSAKPGRSFAVPQYVVSVAAGDADAQRDTVERLLAGDTHDLVVWVEQPPPDSGDAAQASETLRYQLHGDPRVRCGPAGGALTAFCAAQFHVFVAAGAPVTADLVSGLRKRLTDSADVAVSGADTAPAVLARARYLHRELRHGLEPSTLTAHTLAATLQAHATPGESRSPGNASGARVAPGGGTRSTAVPAAISEPARSAVSGPLPRLRKLGRIGAYTVAEARSVRSRRDAARLARTIAAWASRAATWRVRWVAWKGRQAARRTRLGVSRSRAKARGFIHRRRRTTVIRPAHYRLGPSVAAHGPKSTAVFAAWARLRTEPTEPADIVVSDYSSVPSAWAPRSGGTVIPLAELAPTAGTPAFDAEQVNPAGWPEASTPAAALGTPELLPGGHVRFRRVRAANLTRARSCHHVDDVAAYHDDPRSRAGTVAMLAAAGAVVRLSDGGGEVAALLGEPLHALMTDTTIETASRSEREALSVGMRREALRTHSLRARARQLCESAASTDMAPLPLVSVLLATRRPDLVPAAVAAVAAQTYRKVELVLAAHGEGFDPDLLQATVAGCGIEARVVTVPADRVLGEVLNSATKHSRGDLVTKFDDDDFYGPEHLWDLVLAHEYSGAALVGKAAEYVYLQGADRTLRRFRGGAETGGSKLTLAGGAMLIARRDLDAVMGWQPVPSGVDKALMEDVAASGRLLYRTHGRGYVLVRHARGHTWQVDDEYFLKQAVEVRDGCDLAFAGALAPETTPAPTRPHDRSEAADTARASALGARSTPDDSEAAVSETLDDSGAAVSETLEAGADYSLGAEIATRGDRAAAVFAASSRVGPRLHHSTDVLLADTPELLASLPPDAAGVSLSQLPPSASVPAVDPQRCNPVGWRPAIDTAPDAADTERTDPRRLRRAHHVKDWTDSGDDPAARAGELAATAATGAMVCIPRHDPDLEACLGTELHGLMSDVARVASAGIHERETLSIAMRRAALRDHSLRARARQVLAAAGLDAPALPLVSVLAPTLRPERLADIIAAVDAQSYPQVELVAALHGDGFEPGLAERQLEQLGVPAQAVRVPQDRSLGEVLNAALEASSGALVAKFDDDDLYSPEHLWDLVLAAEYSGAEVVTKASEYVYLAGADRTVRRFVGLGERFIDPVQHSVTGGAMLMARPALERIGGWRPMGVGEDKALAQDLAAAGSRVYRTHGRGYVLVRHGAGHTWEVDDSYFLEQAQDGRDGCDRRFAGVA